MDKEQAKKLVEIAGLKKVLLAAIDLQFLQATESILLDAGIPEEDVARLSAEFMPENKISL